MRSDNGFESFHRKIKSEPLGVLLAKWQRDAFIAKLKQLPDVEEVIPSGSLARGTQIGPVHDVDLIVVFDKAEHPDFGHGGPESAQAALTYLQRKLLEQLHPFTDCLRAQGATEDLVENAVVNEAVLKDTVLKDVVKDTERRTHVVTCSGGWIGEFTDIIPSAPPVDVMPAVREGSHLLIPERETGWINVDPEKLMRQVAQRQREWKYFTEVVGMMKAWARENMPGMKSLAVEVMVLKYCPRPGFFETLSCGEAVAQLFEKAAKKLTSLEDPTGRCGEIDPDLDYGELQKKLSHAARLARQAMEAEYALESPLPGLARLRHPDYFWHKLFGKKYPSAREKAQLRFWRDPLTDPWFGKYGRRRTPTPGWDDLGPFGPDDKGPNGPGSHGPDDHSPDGPDDLSPNGPHDHGPKGPDDPGPKCPPGSAHDLGERHKGPYQGGADVPRPGGIVGEPGAWPRPENARVTSGSRSANTGPGSAEPGINLWTGVFRSAAVTISVPLTFG
jgi:hypothetical protein